MSFLLITPLGNNGFNSVASKPSPNSGITASLISGHTGGTASGSSKGLRNSHGLQQRLKASRLMLLPRRHFDRKRDERGRVVDIHPLRHTFGTHLSKAGVTPRVAMAAMRHSSLDLTMNIYTDPVLLDVGAAVDALLDFSADKPAVPMATMPV